MRQITRFAGIGLAGLAAFLLPSAAGAFTVSTIADSGAGSLRQAMMDLNASAAAGTIDFAIPGASCPTVCTITLAGPLPALLYPATIDGYTQPGAMANTLAVGNDAVLKIEINGNGVNQAAIRLMPGAVGSVVRGLAINNFGAGGFGIVVQADDCVVQGNFIGTNPAGTAVVGSGAGLYGVAVTGGVHVRIGGTLSSQRNLISGSSGGIAVYGGTGGDLLIRNNYVGTNAAGTAAIHNNYGIIVGLSPGDIIGDATNGGVTIGGLGPGEPNVVSGNQCVGIQAKARENALIQFLWIVGNIVGLDATATSAVGNGCSGIDVQGDPLEAGFGLTVQANIIAANGFAGHSPGVVLSAPGGRLWSNFIGTNPAYAVGLGNYGSGVFVTGFPTSPAAVGGLNLGNVIVSSGGYGIEFSETFARVAGNWIGVSGDAGLTTALPNQAGGILVESSNVFIGDPGMNLDLLNYVADNGGDGIFVQNTTAVTAHAMVFGNSIFNNTGLGINLAPGGVTPNDPGDADTGANDLQNYPVLTSAVLGPGNTVSVSGSLNSTPSQGFVIILYGSPGCDGSGHGEGKVILGTDSVTTDAGGNGTFGPTSFPLPVGLASISATATYPIPPVGAGDRSEFSACVTPTGVGVSSIIPSSGLASGVAGVGLLGSNFAAGAGVTVGGVSATGVAVNSSTSITLDIPSLGPGALYPVTVTNTDLSSGTLNNAWFADFLDVPSASPFHSFVEKLVRNSITAGCGAGNYCPGSSVTRAQMAVFLLRSKNGPLYSPPACAAPTFTDVPCSSPFAPWVNELAAAGVTAGCGAGIYCPGDPVTRAQMAVFLLRTYHPPAFTPPACVTPTFADVPCSSGFAPWVNELALEGVTAGCGGGNYCPANAVTRGQMAVFLVTMFHLP